MPTRSRKPHVLVVGLGNVLLQDDGVGVHAVRELAKAPLQDARILEVGCAIFDALYYLERADRVLAIDAMQAGGVPGTIYRCDIEQIADDGRQASLHELGLVAALGFLASTHRPQIDVLGIEPAIIDYGTELSQPLATALPFLLNHARQIVNTWRA